MNLAKTIEDAAKIIGSQKELEQHLDMARGYLSDVKSGRRGLPNIAQAKLEELLDLPTGTLRAPSEIITEKNEAKRAYWKKKIGEGVAASFMAIITGVILNMSPPLENQAGAVQHIDNTVYYVKLLNC